MKSLKRLLLVLAIALVPSAVFAQTGMNGLISSNAPNLNSGLTNWAGISHSGVSWNATENRVQQVIPVSGTFHDLRVCLSGASGTGTRAFTIRKNGADTAVTTSITNATCSADTTHSFSVTAGDLVNLQQVTSGTLNSVTIRWSAIFTAANSNEYPTLLASIGQVGAGATKYFGMQGSDGGQFTEQFSQIVMPTGGTISRLFIQTDTNAVTSTLVGTFRKNGSDTSLTASVAAGSSTANDTSNSVAVSAGDILSVKFVNNGSAALRLSTGFKFAPTTDGESIAMCSSTSNTNQATTAYAPAMGAMTFSGTEGNFQQLVQNGTMKKLTVATFSNVGGSGQTMTAVARLNTADSALTCAINSGAAACTDGAHSVTLANDDVVNYSFTNSATTGTDQPYAGMVFAMPTNTPNPTPTPAGGSQQHLSVLGAG